MTTNQINYLKTMTEYDIGQRNWFENVRHNLATEGISTYQQNEARRHNLAEEANKQWATRVERAKNRETARHNKANEQLDQYGKDIQREYNLGTLGNAARANELRGSELDLAWTDLLYRNEFKREDQAIARAGQVNAYNIADMTSARSYAASDLVSGRNLAGAYATAAASEYAARMGYESSVYATDANVGINEMKIGANLQLQEDKYNREMNLQDKRNEGNLDVQSKANTGKYWSEAIRGGFNLLGKAIDVGLPLLLQKGGSSIGF